MAMDYIKGLVAAMTQPRFSGRQQTVEKIAARMGIATKTLYAYGESLNLPAKLVAPLTNATGDRTLLDAILEAADCEPSRPKNPAVVCRDTAMVRTVKEVGEALVAASTLDDVDAIQREITEAQAALSDLRATAVSEARARLREAASDK